jgi:hypothetical protein
MEEVAAVGAASRVVLGEGQQLQQQERHILFIASLKSHRGSAPAAAPASSNTSLITMPPTTGSMKTHTGHGHKHPPAMAVLPGGDHRSRHHSGHSRPRHHRHMHQHHDLSPGLTTPTPVQQSSEVYLLFMFYILHDLCKQSQKFVFSTTSTWTPPRRRDL